MLNVSVNDTAGWMDGWMDACGQDARVSVMARDIRREQGGNTHYNRD